VLTYNINIIIRIQALRDALIQKNILQMHFFILR
jgi:hypothetical protein